MYVTPIRLDLLLNTNQISCCEGEWYVRRFDPNTVENGHNFYLFFYKRGGSIDVLGLPQHFLWVRLRILWAGLIVISNWILSQRNIVFGI